MAEKPDLRIDYVEFPAIDMEATKAFYSAAFGWNFVDYGPDYAAIQGAYLDGGFDLSAPVAPKLGKEGHGEKLRVTAGVLVVLYAADLEITRGGKVGWRSDFEGDIQFSGWSEVSFP